MGCIIRTGALHEVSAEGIYLCTQHYDALPMFTELPSMINNHTNVSAYSMYHATTAQLTAWSGAVYGPLSLTDISTCFINATAECVDGRRAPLSAQSNCFAFYMEYFHATYNNSNISTVDGHYTMQMIGFNASERETILKIAPQVYKTINLLANFSGPPLPEPLEAAYQWYLCEQVESWPYFLEIIARIKVQVDLPTLYIRDPLKVDIAGAPFNWAGYASPKGECVGVFCNFAEIFLTQSAFVEHDTDNPSDPFYSGSLFEIVAHELYHTCSTRQQTRDNHYERIRCFDEAISCANVTKQTELVAAQTTLCVGLFLTEYDVESRVNLTITN